MGDEIKGSAWSLAHSRCLGNSCPGVLLLFPLFLLERPQPWGIKACGWVAAAE